MPRNLARTVRALLSTCAALLVFVSGSSAQPILTAKQTVDYVKGLDVRNLDPTLPSQRLEDWLRSGLPHLKVLRWQDDNTCDNKPDDRSIDYPRCVRVDFSRDGWSGWFLILIGTLKTGIKGPPQLYYISGVFEAGFVYSGITNRLSGLPALLDQPLMATPVAQFYEKATVLHPMGLPVGAAKTTLWQFLSTRLTQQLETAQACESDYLRLHPDGDIASKPAWMTRDLFSGEDDPAAPFFVNTVHREPLKDGAFSVQLNVVEQNTAARTPSIVAGGIRAYAVKQQWAILATVVPEDHRFVIDDIRIFEANSTDGSSRLLSASFIGCDGRRWVGK